MLKKDGEKKLVCPVNLSRKSRTSHAALKTGGDEQSRKNFIIRWCAVTIHYPDRKNKGEIKGTGTISLWCFFLPVPDSAIALI
jgi:hypothetical protein